MRVDRTPISTLPHTHSHSRDTLAVGCARLGQPDQKIVAGTLAELAGVDFGEPLHCMVICGELHPCEVELLEFFKVKKTGEGQEQAAAGTGEEEGDQ